MLKKNLWIAALLLALSLTAFFIIGCVSPLAVVEDTETYEEYPLDKGYNAWAGQVYQKGWAIGGIKFQGKGDAIVIAKDLGYDIEMFQKATKLKIEMPDASYPRSGVDIIWGGEDETGDSTKGGGMWNQQPIAGGSGDVDATFAKKDGNVLIIDLTKALKNYSAYTKASKLKIVMQVNAPSYGDVEGLVQKAYLMIPSTPPPFVSIVDKPPVPGVSLAVPGITLKENTMLWTNELVLDAVFNPENATEKAVVWSIKSFQPKGGSKIGIPSVDLSSVETLEEYEEIVEKYEEAKKKLFEKVRWQQEEYLIDDTVWPNIKGLRDVPGVITATEAGKIIVRAFVKNAKQDPDTGKLSDYISKDLEITVNDPQTFWFKINGNYTSTVRYGAVDNGGVSGGKFALSTQSTDPTDSAKKIYTGYTATYSPTGGQYGNSAHYVEIKFPAGKKLDDYKQITCHYKSDNCDLTGKSVRAKAMIKKPNRTYNPGPYIATISFSEGSFATGSNGKDTDLIFDLYKDNAQNADGTSNQGIYKAGVGADLSTSTANADIKENSSRFITKDPDDNDVNLKDANKIYLWFLPWGGVGTEFTISDINFVPK